MDEFRERLHRIEIILAKQEENLREHMRRSDSLEQQTEIIRRQLLLWAVSLSGGLAMALYATLLHK